MFRDLIDAILRLLFGHNTVDNTVEWKKAREKANQSREEVSQIIKDANKKG